MKKLWLTIALRIESFIRGDKFGQTMPVKDVPHGWWVHGKIAGSVFYGRLYRKDGFELVLRPVIQAKMLRRWKEGAPIKFTEESVVNPFFFKCLAKIVSEQ